MSPLKRKAISNWLSSSANKPKKARKGPPSIDENIHDCIVVQMPTPIPTGSHPLATLSSSKINSRHGNTVKSLNTPKSLRSTQTKLNFSTPRPTPTPKAKIRAQNPRKPISPTVVKLKASAEKQLHLVTLHGEDLVGRRRSRRVAKGPKTNYYMESPLESPAPEENKQLGELTNAATSLFDRISSSPNSSATSTPTPSRGIQLNEKEKESAPAIQGTQIRSVSFDEAPTARKRLVRVCTYSSTASPTASPTTPTTPPKRRRPARPVAKTPPVRLADKYPPYLEQLLRDRVYDSEVAADNQMLVFEEEVKQRGWCVGG